MNEIKKIGVLTSGGDCSGLNAAICAVASSALARGWECYGIFNATDGLFSRPMRYRKFTYADLDLAYAKLGGTMLGTNNTGNPNRQLTADGTYETLTDEQLVERFKSGVAELGIDALVVIGGDGSMSIVGGYCQKAGIRMVGIPKTIDNDAPATDLAIGFSTARNIVANALDELETTAHSHQRLMILEVMGRNAGHLALEGAIAGMADICIIPEVPFTYEKIVEKLRKMRASGRMAGLMVVAEGVKPEGKHYYGLNGKTYSGVANYFAERLAQEEDNFNIRVNILGHVQRGGAPTAQDRILASSFAVHATQLLEKNITNRMVIYKDGKVSDIDIGQALEIAHTPVNPHGQMVETAMGLGMYVGEVEKE